MLICREGINSGGSNKERRNTWLSLSNEPNHFLFLSLSHLWFSSFFTRRGNAFLSLRKDDYQGLSWMFLACLWSPGLPHTSEKPGSWPCPSASLVQSHLARWGAPEQKSTLRLKVHQGKISPRYLSCERKNETGGTSILALKIKWVSCWETCGILGPGGRESWSQTCWERRKDISVIPSHSSTQGILLQILETQHLSF